MIRPFEKKLDHTRDNTLGTESDYGPELVVFIPFKGEVRVKSICVCGAPDGMAPRKVKLYKNEETIDINILEEKKPVQIIDLAENLTGEVEYPVSQSKFTNTSSIVLGFDENFGANRTGIKFIGIRGEFLRLKPKMGEIVYEVRANYSKLDGASEMSNASLGL